MTTRRQLLKQALASSAVATASRFAMATGSHSSKATHPNKVMIPMPSMPWTQAQPIGPRGELTPEAMKRLHRAPGGFADLEQFQQDKLVYIDLLKAAGIETVYNDFSLIQDRSSRWHLIGIEGHVKGAGQPTFHHHMSERLLGPYIRLAPIFSGFPPPPQRDLSIEMSAPCAVWKDQKTALIFYGHVLRGIDEKGSEKLVDSAMRVLESHDSELQSWSPRVDPAFPEQNVVFREKYCRDPQVMWDETRQLYLMYYAVGSGWTDPEDQCVLRVRTSPDLSTWSKPRTLMTPPPGHRAVESIFVLQKESLYYLWVCGFDYGRMSLYVSEDPFNFGDPIRSRIMEQHGHTPEVVHSDGQYWMACAAIASDFGYAWGMHDLVGTYIQPLKWMEADGAALAKITRVSAT